MRISKDRPLLTREGAYPLHDSFRQAYYGVRETPPDEPGASAAAADDPDDERESSAASPSLHELLLPVLSDPSLDFQHIATTAGICHERAAAGVRTIGQLLRLVDSDGIATRAFLVADVGGLVAHLADYIDAMSTMEGHALYQLSRRRD